MGRWIHPQVRTFYLKQLTLKMYEIQWTISASGETGI
jgi:hypothetical protein